MEKNLDALKKDQMKYMKIFEHVDSCDCNCYKFR